MVLFRFLAIIFLAYFGYRFFSKIREENQKMVIEKEDILEEDPVCKRLVPRKQAVVYEKAGQKIYFCGKECCKKYRKEKEKNEDK